MPEGLEVGMFVLLLLLLLWLWLLQLLIDVEASVEIHVPSLLVGVVEVIHCASQLRGRDESWGIGSTGAVVAGCQQGEQ